MNSIVKFFALLSAMLLCAALNAQDIVYMRDGSSIKAKVTEVGTDELVYKRWSNLEGPDYRVKLSNVSRIDYQNGESDYFGAADEDTMVRRLRGQIGDKELDIYAYGSYPEGTIYRDGSSLFIKDAYVKAGAVLDPDLYSRWKSNVNTRWIGMSLWSCLGAPLLLVGVLSAAASSDMSEEMQSNFEPVTILVGAASIAVGIPLHLIANKNLDEIVNEQNARRNPGEAFAPRISIGAQPHGIGFALNF